MVEIDDTAFEDLIGQALDELPEEYVKRLLEQVVVTWAYEPSPEQRQELHLRNDQSLYGLYEGLPLTQRFLAGNKITPDKITIFKSTICRDTHDLPSLKDQIKKTVWHEMAHYFGLDHKRIRELGG